MTPERRKALADLAAGALSRSLAITTEEREALDAIVLYFATGGTGPGAALAPSFRTRDELDAATH